VASGAIPPPPPPAPPAAPTGFGDAPRSPGHSATPPPPGYQAYTPNPTSKFRRANFGLRLGAWLLDYLLYSFLAAVLAVPAVLVIISAFAGCARLDGDVVCLPGELDGSLLVLGVLLALADLAVVFAIYVRALGATGQTWGRRIVGVKVVGSLTGEPIGLGAATGRQLFALVVSVQIFFLGYLWMLWDGRRQTWHDSVVGSIVILT